MLFMLNLHPPHPPSETATSRQGSIVGNVSSLLWVDTSLPHHVVLPSGVPPAVGCGMPVRRRARTRWEVAVVQGGVAITSVPPHSATHRVLPLSGSPDAVISSLAASPLNKPACRDLSPQDSLQPSLLSPNSVIPSHLTSQFNVLKTLRWHKENTGSCPHLHG